MEQKIFKKDFQLNFWLIVILTGIILIGLLGGIIISQKTNSVLDKKATAAKEAARPANLDLVVLKEPTCQDCFDLKPLIESIRKQNVKINSERTVELASAEGQELINRLQITQVPTLVITGEIEKDSALKDLWSKSGEIKDNTFILRRTGTPYVLTNSGEVRGRVKLVMLKDRSCQECYDIASHEIILKNFGFPTQNQETLEVDSQDGRKLIEKYQIKLVPTIILSGDVPAYLSLVAIWPQVGTIEKDGTYVFREGVKQMGIYKDLTTNRIIKPVAPTANQSPNQNSNPSQ